MALEDEMRQCRAGIEDHRAVRQIVDVPAVQALAACVVEPFDMQNEIDLASAGADVEATRA